MYIYVEYHNNNLHSVYIRGPCSLQYIKVKVFLDYYNYTKPFKVESE